MFKDLLNSITGVEIWPLIGLFIFVGVFLGVIIWIFRLDKGLIQRMKNLPLESDSTIKNGD